VGSSPTASAATRPGTQTGKATRPKPGGPVGSTPTRATRGGRIGWCSSRRPVKPLPSSCEAEGGRFDSFTTHWRFSDHGPFVYRHRTPVPQAGEARSIPARTTPRLAGWRNWQKRGPQKHVPPRRGSSNLPPATQLSRRAGARPGLISPACPARYRGLGLRVGRCSAEFHTLGGGGSTPRPATVGVPGTVR
jgi:hypothetical protein